VGVEFTVTIHLVREVSILKHNAMTELSPKRRTFDDAIDVDTALNPARNYPRKRVAVAVSIQLLTLFC
jgi:hypothetical protein